ncbi:MAG: ABC transporter ATP-binding protein [Ardenticatenaceae bacterium]|nr:ABC transporter ATP-binding protein [Ardenticatenaceae bacterium]
MSEFALEVKNITKRFPGGVIANKDVNFALRKGEIHALLGENGAGKSTLMNVIYGLYAPEEGEIWVDGQKTEIDNPNDAIRKGIGMVHQHFMLVPVFTVAENIMLGAEELQGGRLDISSARKKIRELSRSYNLEVDPRAIVEDLPVGMQQRVEIVKALYRDAKILVLDEPTAVLTPQEADDLFIVMRELTERGVSIIFITHKLREVLAVADTITVMRRGEVVGTTSPEGKSESDLAAMMVGREVLLRVEKEEAHPAQTVLEVKDLTVHDERGLTAVKNISFDLKAGEILGIAGVQGNGQTELAEVLTGIRAPESGTIIIDGQKVPAGNPRYLFEHGMAHVPEDRHKHGLVLPYDLVENVALNTYYKPPFRKGLVRDEEAMLEATTDIIEAFDVRTSGPFSQASNLSGGNQQKVIVGRELSRPIQFLVVNQPTRGLDVGSIEFIHRRIIEERDKGVAVLLISAELDEILGLADRILVMFHGELVAEMPVAKANKEKLGLLMAGSEA